jgi:Tfp pilus assembly protein PilF
MISRIRRWMYAIGDSSTLASPRTPLPESATPLAGSAQYCEAVKRDPSYALPHNGLANVLVHAGKPEEAIAQYRAAIVLDPQYGYPHNGLGDVLAEENNFADAAAEYRKAIQLNPKYAGPHDGLGMSSP